MGYSSGYIVDEDMIELTKSCVSSYIKFYDYLKFNILSLIG